MKKVSLAIVVLLASVEGAAADACKEKFIQLMTDREAKEPTRIFITQEIKGGAKSENWHYQDGKGNWLTEMVKPDNAPWSMQRDNILYSSADKGKTWTKVREMDEQQEDTVRKALEERTATVSNAVCGEVELGGIKHETVEADYKMIGSFNADIHDKFWVNPSNGYVSRLETNMKSAAFESSTTQALQPAPYFVMPTPK